MTATHNQGPMIAYGYTPGTGGSNPEAGPSADYQGSSILDVRFPYQPGNSGIGHVKAFLNYAYACMVDAIPATATAGAVATIPAASVVPAGGTLTPATGMQTTNSGVLRAVNIPLVPYGRGLSVANRVSVTTLDPGHTKVTTSVSSRTVTIPAGSDARLVKPGQYVCIPGAAGTGIALIARVISKTLAEAGNGTMVLDTAASAVVTAGPLMLMDMAGISVIPHFYAGAVAEFDPHSTLTRCLVYTSNNVGDTGYSVTAVGYDAIGNLMTETVAITANGTVTGRKAFKHILRFDLLKTGGGTLTGTIAIGTSDTFGFNLKSEAWEYVNLYWAGAYASVSTGYTAGDATDPSTAASNDTRGTYTVQSASNGTNRLAIFMSLPARQALASTWDDPSTMHGVIPG
jgi:hypothetical protein